MFTCEIHGKLLQRIPKQNKKKQKKNRTTLLARFLAFHNHNLTPHRYICDNMTSYRIPCDITDIFQWKFHLHFIRRDKIHRVPLTTSKKDAKETARYKWVARCNRTFWHCSQWFCCKEICSLKPSVNIDTNIHINITCESKNTKVGLNCVMKFYCTLCTCTLKYNFFTDRVREALNFILFDTRCGVSLFTFLTQHFHV